MEADDRQRRQVSGRRFLWAALLAALVAGALLWRVASRGERERGSAPEVPSVRLDDGYAWIQIPLARLTDLAGLPVTVEMQGDVIRCRRPIPGQRILVLTFQQRAEGSAYGAYALAGAKRDLPLDAPLDGDPVSWPDRDHAAALGYQLTLAGLDESRAQEATAQHGDAWFAEGLRVFLVLPRKAAEAVNLFAEIPQGSDGPYLLLVAVELPEHRPPRRT